MEEIVYDGCFGCGKGNPHGLQLEFVYRDEEAVAEYVFGDRFTGYENTIHGGLIATILDEAMAKIILHKGMIAVTAQLTTRYRRPLHPGEHVVVKGSIAVQKSRTLHTVATLSGVDGSLIAEAEAVYIVKRQV